MTIRQFSKTLGSWLLTLDLLYLYCKICDSLLPQEHKIINNWNQMPSTFLQSAIHKVGHPQRKGSWRNLNGTNPNPNLSVLSVEFFKCLPTFCHLFVLLYHHQQVLVERQCNYNIWPAQQHNQVFF